MARRNGVTLIVTVLHCTSLQEITSAEQLLNWGFAMNGKVKPVGMLVPPLAAAASSTGGPRRGGAHKAADAAAVTPEPGPLGTAGLAIGGVAIAALGLGGLLMTRRRAAMGHAGRMAADAPSAESVPDVPSSESVADGPSADSANDAPRAGSVES
jgi:hypothetical protein